MNQHEPVAKPPLTPRPSAGDRNGPVVVQSRPFFSTLVRSVANVICVTVICASVVAVYAIHTVDNKVEQLIENSPEALRAIVDWQEALPPALADAIHDRRAPEYQNQVRTSVEIVEDEHRRRVPVVEVTNEGDQVVSLLSLRVAYEDERGVPAREVTCYAATPVAVDSEWRGPLLPGSTRRFTVDPIYGSAWRDWDVSIEVSELRVWDETPRVLPSEGIGPLDGIGHHHGPSEAATVEETGRDETGDLSSDSTPVDGVADVD